MHRLEPNDGRQIRAGGDAQRLRDFLAELSHNPPIEDPRAIKHAVAVILPSLKHYEDFHDYFLTSFGSQRMALELWGAIQLMIEVLYSPGPELVSSN